MKLEDLKTWDDLNDYLLLRMDYATNETSRANSSFTKKEHWNSLIGECMKYDGLKTLKSIERMRKAWNDKYHV